MKIVKLISNYLDSNTFILIKGKSALIIDSAVDTEKVKQVVEDLKVEGILLTHGHYDHSLNVNEYAQTFSTKVYVNKNARETLKNPELNYGKTFKIDDFTNFEFIDGDGKLKLGNFKIEYFHTPGHSTCLNSYLIDKNLFVGDCIFRDGIGRTDLLTSNKDDMIDSLKKLEKLDFSMCYSGHYEDSDNARMNKNIKLYIKFFTRNKN